jgi:hypothetical protein
VTNPNEISNVLGRFPGRGAVNFVSILYDPMTNNYLVTTKVQSPGAPNAHWLVPKPRKGLPIRATPDWKPLADQRT